MASWTGIGLRLKAYKVNTVPVDYTGPDGTVAKSSAKWTDRYWIHISVQTQTQSGYL